MSRKEEKQRWRRVRKAIGKVAPNAPTVMLLRSIYDKYGEDATMKAINAIESVPAKPSSERFGALMNHCLSEGYSDIVPMP